ncbi:MAG: multidrug effflux MFS transporter [Gammaproteobacteria bacterium]|nr:multidrug effflux MFS transporter [Gammaproteobacteria bacterium]
MWRKGDAATLAILGPLAFGFAVALDIYIPVVPHLVGFFHTTVNEVQLTLSLFMVFIGIGQLLWGPLADHFGRRKIALGSLLLYILGSVFCAFSNSIHFLIFGRCVEAVGACGTMVVSMAVIRDAYDERSSARMYSLLNGMVSASPLFAPIIGGYLVTWFNWRASFIFLIILGCIMTLIVMFFLDESLAFEDRIKADWSVFKRYVSILTNSQFLFYTFVAASGISYLFTFFSLSPYLFIQELHVATDHFGFYFGVLGAVFFAGSILSSWVAPRLGVSRTVWLGILLAIIGGVLMAIWVQMAGLTILDFIVPMLPIGIGAAFMVGAGAAGALAPFGNMAGTAAAVLGCGQFFVSAIAGSIVLYYKTGTPMPLAILTLLLGTLCMLFMLLARKRLRD